MDNAQHSLFPEGKQLVLHPTLWYFISSNSGRVKQNTARCSIVFLGLGQYSATSSFEPRGHKTDFYLRLQMNYHYTTWWLTKWQCIIGPEDSPPPGQPYHVLCAFDHIHMELAHYKYEYYYEYNYVFVQEDKHHQYNFRVTILAVIGRVTIQNFILQHERFAKN